MNRGPFTIGRDRSAHLFLDDPSVSRLHAAVIERNGEWILQDMGGRNLPCVHGRPVVSVPLHTGDVIQLGSTQLRVASIGEGRATSATGRGGDETVAFGGAESAEALATERAPQLAGGPFWRVLESWTELIRKLDNEAHLLEVILDGFLRVIPADRIGIYKKEPSGSLQPIASKNIEGENPLEYSETMVARAMQDRVPKLYSPQIDEGSARTRSMIRKKIKTALCFPLLTDDEAWGVVYLDQTSEERPPLLPADLELGTLLAHWVAEALEKGERFREMDEEILRLRKGDSSNDLLVGESPQLKGVRRRIRKVAKTDVSVLITGESGTGKELVARGIHRVSERRGGPFVAINCAAIPENLLESELFGYAPRSGIHGSDPAGKPGRFELASGGSIFLDEVGELAPTVQAKLLRVLEDRKVDRIGAQEAVSVDVHVIAATNRDLESEVRAGRFREDLYYRLRVFPIEIPPLRERPEDILPLAHHILGELAPQKKIRVSPRAVEMIRNHLWPGNVRELKNVLLEALLVGDGRSVSPRDLPSLAPVESLSFQTLREIERHHITQVLEGVNWNKKKAAEILGIHRSTLYEKINEHQLEPKSAGSGA